MTVLGPQPCLNLFVSLSSCGKFLQGTIRCANGNTRFTVACGKGPFTVLMAMLGHFALGGFLKGAICCAHGNAQPMASLGAVRFAHGSLLESGVICRTHGDAQPSALLKPVRFALSSFLLPWDINTRPVRFTVACVKRPFTVLMAMLSLRP